MQNGMSEQSQRRGWLVPIEMGRAEGGGSGTKERQSWDETKKEEADSQWAKK